MHWIHQLITAHALVAWGVLAVSFALLAKCADIFVESAISLAYKFKLPKLVVGIVLVAFATTAPELAVSAISAFRGKADIALGNAIGSVICDTGLGLSLCALFSVAAIPLVPRVIKQGGNFLLIVAILAFVFTMIDGTLSRWEGAILLAGFGFYMFLLFRDHKRGMQHDESDWETIEAHPDLSMVRLVASFLLALVGIILTSDLIVTSATAIARALHVPDGIIALTLIAFGTSVPEIATCIAAARKGHAALAVGNILGADIMNICWVAGASSMINTLSLTKKELLFMFPSMFVLVITAQALVRRRWRLARRHGAILLTLYLLYLLSSLLIFKPV